MVLPWLKTSGKALLRKGVGTGLQVAQDALSGWNLEKSMQDIAKQAGQRLLTRAINNVQQSGRGVRRRRKRAAPPGDPVRKRIKRAISRRRSQSKKQHKIRQTKNKRSKKHHSDIFAQCR